jgi:hypothetical protein
MTRQKKDSDDRRVILDLSWPLHASVNGGTKLDSYMGESYKLLLPTVDDFARVLAFFGRGTYMWGLDLRRAFRQIRIDPLDWPLIGLSWDGCYYTNISVAFGIRHGAAFTQRVSQAVCDILGAEQITSIPYIDDFIGGQPSLSLATAAYNRSLHLFAELGLDLNPKKCTSPTTTITWIGVTYNTLDMTMKIPTRVIQETKAMVEQWLHKAKATRHELQCLLGKLFHAGKCCPSARIFVGRMLVTLRDTPPTGSSNLSIEFRANLTWWKDMLPTYNGRFLIQLSRPQHHLYIEVLDNSITVRTDTLTTTAPTPANVSTNDHRWANRECYAVLVALHLWGVHWLEAELLIHCRDPKKLQVLVHGRSRHQAIMHIARQIWSFTAQYDIVLTPTTHIAVGYAHLQVVEPPSVKLI